MPVARVAGPRLHSSEMEPVVAQGFFPGRPMVKRMRLRGERIRELIILCLRRGVVPAAGRPWRRRRRQPGRGRERARLIIPCRRE